MEFYTGIFHGHFELFAYAVELIGSERDHLISIKQHISYNQYLQKY